MMREPVLDADEQQAMDDLLACMNRINGWGLRANGAELAAAVHVVQGFIIQHMLSRLTPDQWGNWYGSRKAE